MNRKDNTLNGTTGSKQAVYPDLEMHGDRVEKTWGRSTW